MEKRGFNLRVKAVLTPINAPKVYEWVSLMAGLGVEKLSVAAYNRTFYRHDESLFLSNEDRELIGGQCRRARADFPDFEPTSTTAPPLGRLPRALAPPMTACAWNDR